MHLVQVPIEAVNPIWPRVEPHLERAIETTHGTHTIEAVLSQLMSGHRHLWIVVGDAPDHEVVAAGVTSLQLFPSGIKALQVELLGGSNMKAWFDLKEQLESAAKAEGCTKIVNWVRKGWVKHLPDYHLTHYLVQKDLN